MKLYEPTIAILLTVMLLFQGYSLFHEYKKTNETLEQYFPDDNVLEESIEVMYQGVTGQNLDISKRSPE
jgi:hypothetical protein